MKSQVNKILTEVFDSYEMLNKMWGIASGKDLIQFMQKYGVELQISILGYRGGMDRYSWYKFVDTLPKNAWIDAITLKPKFRAKNQATGSMTRHTESELFETNRGNYKTVYQLKAKYKNKKEKFQTEYENYEYVLACECLSWLKRECDFKGLLSPKGEGLK